MLFRNVSNCTQPKAGERKIVGAQKLAYQASSREREATHGGPKYFFFMNQVLCCGSSREMLRAENRYIVCGCAKYGYSKAPKCCDALSC